MRLISLVAENFGGNRDHRLIEMPVKICCQCEEIGDGSMAFQERIQATIEGADVKVREMVAQWKSLVKVGAR